MRSCKYLRVSGSRKTKLLMVQNFRFFSGKRLIPHSDPSIHLAETVSITFEFQKRDTKSDVITHYKTSDSLLCPIKIWSCIIKGITSNPLSSSTTTLYTFFSTENKIHYFSGLELLSCLWMAAASIGPDELGFTPDQIGLHSARSGAAMAMYLVGVPVFTIMLLGQWSSDAFLLYIRKQVKEFSSRVSSKMIRHEKFFTIPSVTPAQNPNSARNSALQHTLGRGFRDAIRPLIKAFQ